MRSGDLILLERLALEQGQSLRPEQLVAFDRLGDELVSWNRRINLTSITSPEEIVIKHFIDSLTLVPHLHGNETLLDIGSGAGFPALPLKILLPELTVVSVDSVLKKIHFQRHIIRLLALTGISALHNRVETMYGDGMDRFDVITSRAFASLAVFAELAIPLLNRSGKIIAMKGPEGEQEAAAAADKLHQLGLRVASIVHTSLPNATGQRSIITLQNSPP